MPKVGRSIDDMLEAEAGGLVSRLAALSDLSSAAYTVGMEFEHDDEEAAVTLVRLARELEEYLERLSVAPDASLTLYRQCRRCSGKGKTQDEDPCIECGGSGHVHAEEAEE